MAIQTINYIIHVDFVSVEGIGIIMPKLKVECLEVPLDKKRKREYDAAEDREVKKTRYNLPSIQDDTLLQQSQTIFANSPTPPTED